jgi:hypothetical protein
MANIGTSPTGQVREACNTFAKGPTSSDSFFRQLRLGCTVASERVTMRTQTSVPRRQWTLLLRLGRRTRRGCGGGSRLPGGLGGKMARAALHLGHDLRHADHWEPLLRHARSLAVPAGLSARNAPPPDRRWPTGAQPVHQSRHARTRVKHVAKTTPWHRYRLAQHALHDLAEDADLGAAERVLAALHDAGSKVAAARAREATALTPSVTSTLAPRRSSSPAVAVRWPSAALCSAVWPSCARALSMSDLRCAGGWRTDAPCHARRCWRRARRAPPRRRCGRAARRSAARCSCTAHAATHTVERTRARWRCAGTNQRLFVDVGATAHQRPRRVRVAAPGGEVQRCPAVLRQRRAARWAGKWTKDARPCTRGRAKLASRRTLVLTSILAPAPSSARIAFSCPDTAARCSAVCPSCARKAVSVVA